MHIIFVFRQRQIVYSFFNPYNYQNLEVTQLPKPGDQRRPWNLKISAMFTNGADLDVLYTKVGGLGAMHINAAEVSACCRYISFKLCQC